MSGGKSWEAWRVRSERELKERRQAGGEWAPLGHWRLPSVAVWLGAGPQAGARRTSRLQAGGGAGTPAGAPPKVPRALRCAAPCRPRRARGHTRARAGDGAPRRVPPSPAPHAMHGCGAAGSPASNLCSNAARTSVGTGGGSSASGTASAAATAAAASGAPSAPPSAAAACCRCGCGASRCVCGSSCSSGSVSSTVGSAAANGGAAPTGSALDATRGARGPAGRPGRAPRRHSATTWALHTC